MNECCNISNEPVKWTIRAEDINRDIVPYLTKGHPEYSGTIIFEDRNCRKYNGNGCNKQICDKTSKKIQKSGDSGKDSVNTPLAYVNWHTHPESCYIAEKVKWGWPSGEDMKVCLSFANENNLAHVVFACEGSYVIKIMSKPLRNTWGFIENILKTTHKLRSIGDDRELVDNFNRELLHPIGINRNYSHALEQWIHLINILTPNVSKMLCNLHGLCRTKASKKAVKSMPKSGDNRIYDVKFVPNGKSITFSQGYVNQNCSL